MLKKRRNRIFLWIFAVIIFLNLIIIITDYTYLYKTFYYLQANIDDYEIFDNRKVEAGNYVPIANGKTYNKSKLKSDFRQYLEKYETVSFLVIKNDSVAYEEYWDGYGQDSYSNSFSMAKSITSILTGIAIDEGKIKSVDQKVSDFIPEYATGSNAKLTVKHLLNMSTSFDWDESYGNPLSTTTRAYYGKGLEKLVLNFKVLGTPGIQNKYQSCNSLVLAYIIKKATGKNISEYASEKLWKPLGAKNPALWSLDEENGFEKSYCCFNSNARDFARIGLLYLHNGVFNKKQIVSEKFVQESITAADIVNKSGVKISHYGYSWWLTHVNDEKVFYARGILGQYVLVIPSKNIVIVRLGKHDPSKEEKSMQDVILEYVVNNF
jgi:CubicO group peptidase (beta-lactamase class C family)